MAQIFYFCPDIPRPSGGVRTMYHHVQHLVDAGYPAGILHNRSGFRLEWFSSRVPVTYWEDSPQILPEDWVVVPEVPIDHLRALLPHPCHRVVLCQNHFYVFEALPPRRQWRDYGVEHVLVSATEIHAFVKHVFDQDAAYVPYAIDHDLFFPRPDARRLQIAYMPRKGAWNIRQVRGMLWHRRPDLRSIPWVPLEGLEERDVARVLQESAFFLSTSQREGFGLPPVEAMATGAIVVGFTGGGGLEYATGENGFWVVDEDAIGLARTLEQVLEAHQHNPNAPKWEALRRASVQTAQQYRFERQKEHLLGFWSSVFKEHDRRPHTASRRPLEGGSSPFEANLHVLSRRHPHLAARMRSAGRPGRADIEGTQEEVRQALDNLSFRAEDASLVLGFGLGGHLEEICRRMEMDHQVFVVEPSEGFFRMALECRDLRALLENDRLHLALGTASDALETVLKPHQLRIAAGGLNWITWEPSARAFPESYQQAGDALKRCVHALQADFWYCSRHPSVLENTLTSLPRLLETTGVASLRGTLEGLPAVIVASPPSPSHEEAVQALQGRALVIAAESALASLLHRGVRPDLVVVSSPEETTAHAPPFPEGPSSIPLVFDPRSAASVVNRFKGPAFACISENSLSRWIAHPLGDATPSGKTTSADLAAFHVAREMGADPIVLIDSRLGPSHGRVDTEDPETRLAVRALEREAARTETRCILLHEGHLRIRGAETLNLEQVLEELPEGNRGPVPLCLRTAPSPERETQRKTFLREISALHQEASTVRRLAGEVRPLIQTARRSIEAESYASPAFQQAVTRIQALDQRLGELALFDRVMKDFQAETVAYQHLQSYRIQRAESRKETLALSLDSMERAFRDLCSLAERMLPWLAGLAGVQEPHPHMGEAHVSNAP